MFFAPVLRGESLLPSPAFDGLDSMVEQLMRSTMPGAGPWHDLQDDGDAWTLTLDIPGVPKEHLQVSIEGRAVRISTSKDARRQFHARYELADELDPQASSGNLEHGVLTLRLAKAQSAQRRLITIH